MPVVALTAELFVKVPVPAMNVIEPDPATVEPSTVIPPDVCWIVTFLLPKSTASFVPMWMAAVPLLRPMNRPPVVVISAI